MIAPQTYVCDMCGKTHAEKRTLIEIELGNVAKNGIQTSFSNQTYHLCDKNNKCIKLWASTLNQNELR